jgi:hypothetical protein
MQADSLAAARLAYMRGDATEEQAARVEEANARGAEVSIFDKMPAVISSPAPVSPPPPPPTAAAASVREEAKAAFDKERQGKHEGGPLGRIGNDAKRSEGGGGEEKPKKSGWFW